MVGSQNLPLNIFEWIEDISQFNGYFIMNYNEERDKGYFLEADDNLHKLHNGLTFLPERMKIEKFEKLVTSLHDKTKYVIHIGNLKQILDHGLFLKKVNSD